MNVSPIQPHVEAADVEPEQLTRQLQPALMAGDDRKPEAQPTAHAGTSVARPSSRSSGHKLHPLHMAPPSKGATPS